MCVFAYTFVDIIHRKIVDRILWHGCADSELVCIERYNIMDIWSDLRHCYLWIECVQLIVHCPWTASIHRHPMRLNEERKKMPRTEKKNILFEFVWMPIECTYFQYIVFVYICVFLSANLVYLENIKMFSTIFYVYLTWSWRGSGKFQLYKGSRHKFILNSQNFK